MKIASIFFFVLTFSSLAANTQYVPARQLSINTNSFGSIVATNDVVATQSTVQTAFEWVDDNFPTNISKTNVYATQTFVSNNFYLASNPSNYYLSSNPSNFLTPAAASNLYYPRQSNPSNYITWPEASNTFLLTSSVPIVISNYLATYDSVLQLQATPSPSAGATTQIVADGATTLLTNLNAHVTDYGTMSNTGSRIYVTSPGLYELTSTVNYYPGTNEGAWVDFFFYENSQAMFSYAFATHHANPGTYLYREHGSFIRQISSSTNYYEIYAQYNGPGTSVKITSCTFSMKRLMNPQ